MEILFLSINKKIIVTKLELFFLWPYHKFQLWSQISFFSTSFWKNRKMDIYKCPKSETQKNFPFKNLQFSSTRVGNFLPHLPFKILYICREFFKYLFFN